MAKTFYEHFKYSMDSLGMPAPASLYASFTTAASTVGAFVAALKTVGAGATMGELMVSAGMVGGSAAGLAAAGEVLAAIGGVVAAAYVGACIGALAYATGQYTSENWVDPIYSWFEAADYSGQLLKNANRMGCSVHPKVSQRLDERLFTSTSGTAAGLPANACNPGRDGDVHRTRGWPKVDSSMLFQNAPMAAR